LWRADQGRLEGGKRSEEREKEGRSQVVYRCQHLWRTSGEVRGREEIGREGEGRKELRF
jgi:hypothetical protein